MILYEQYPIKRVDNKQYHDNSIVKKSNNNGILSRIKKKFKNFKKKIIEIFQLRETKDYIEEKKYVETDDSISMYRKYICKRTGNRCIETYKVYER